MLDFESTTLGLVKRPQYLYFDFLSTGQKLVKVGNGVCSEDGWTDHPSCSSLSSGEDSRPLHAAFLRRKRSSLRGGQTVRRCRWRR